MKKRVWVLLALVLSLLLTACPGAQAPNQGVWDSGKWDESTWQ